MIHSLTQWIMELLREHPALSVFVGVLIESVIVPIPSPLIIMGAGALLIDPSISFSQSLHPIIFQIGLPGSTASTLGAYIAYGIGYWGGKPAIDKFQKFLGFNWEDVQAMEKRFVENRAGLILFSLRAVPIVPLSLISAAAGAIRIQLWPFTLWTFLGSIPRCLFLGYLGWMMHDTYVSIAEGFNFMEGLISALLVLSAVALVIVLRVRMGSKT